jgi:hypothetical protein
MLIVLIPQFILFVKILGTLLSSLTIVTKGLRVVGGGFAKISRAFSFISKFVGPASKGLSGLFNIFGKGRGIVSKVFGFFSKFVGILGKVGGIFAKILPIAGKIRVPIGIVITLIQSIFSIFTNWSKVG